jgi:phosphoglycerate kinase
MKSVKECEIRGKRVIIRCDYDVPLSPEGKITDDYRMEASLETIRYVLKKGAQKIILLAHMGRPKGKVVEGLRTKVVAEHLAEMLKTPVGNTSDCLNVQLPSERIVLLENLRFHAEEEANDDGFAKNLASYGDVYINDAFANSHRAHASMHAITKFIPSYAGLALMKEVEHLSKVTFSPKEPYVAIIGGAKEDKIEVIEALLPKLDYLIIGGMLANTFLKAKGHNLGNSKFSPELLPKAHEIIEKAGDKLVLPTDLVFAEKFERGSATKIFPVNSSDIVNWIAVDIGPETLKNYAVHLRKAKTIFWAGPIGVFEIPEFALGSIKLASFIAGLSSTRIIGGGDSSAAADASGFAEFMTFISTAGGASLEFVAGKKLPGLEVLDFYKDA